MSSSQWTRGGCRNTISACWNAACGGFGSATAATSLRVVRGGSPCNLLGVFRVSGVPARMDSRYHLGNVEELTIRPTCGEVYCPSPTLPFKKDLSRKGLSASRCKAIYAAGAMSGSI